jgi:hypothetical protein
MRYIEPEALLQLKSQILEMKIQGSSTVECSDCALLKITQ